MITPKKKTTNHLGTTLMWVGILIIIHIILSATGAYAFVEPEMKTETLTHNQQGGECTWMEVRYVIDGDTFVLRNGIRIRIIGINTKELDSTKKKDRQLAVEAREMLKRAIAPFDEVCLVTDLTSDTMDTYGRALAHVFNKGGRNIAEIMLKTGLADGYFHFEFDRMEEYGKYKQSAVKNEVGMWRKNTSIIEKLKNFINF